MPSLELTDQTCRAAQLPQAGRTELRDTKVAGLVLRLSAGGVKSWSVSYKHAGLKHRKTLGKFQPDKQKQGQHVGVAKARELARAAIGKASEGQDPRAGEKEAAASGTVADLLDKYEEADSGAGKLKSKADRMRGLRRALHGLRATKVADVSRRDLVVILERTAKGGKVVLANRLAVYIGHLFRWAADTGRVKTNVAERLPKQGVEVPKSRVLDDDEICWLWGLTRGVELPAAARRALRLVLVTGQRPGEVCGALWGEISDSTWTIPPERRKNPRRAPLSPHEVPLSALAGEVVGERPEAAKDTDPVFAGAKGGPLRVDVLDRLLRGAIAMAGAQSFGPHDLRRTCRTRLTGLGVDPVIAELVLGHAPTAVLGRVAATYDHDTRESGKREVLELWANELRRVLAGEGIVTESSGAVVPMRRAKR